MAGLQDLLGWIKGGEVSHVSSDQYIGSDGTKAIAEALKTDKNVRDLSISDGDIGEAGVIAVAEMLETNSTISKLRLQNNKIYAIHSPNRMAKALAINQGLTTFDLVEDKLSDAWALAIAEALRTNKVLSRIWLQAGISEVGVRAIGDALKVNQTLEKLELPNNIVGLDGARAIGEALRTNKSLVELCFLGCKIDDEEAKAIASGLGGNGKLEKLELTYNNIGSAGARALAEALATNDSLIELSLESNNIGDDGARAIGRSLRTTRLISLALDLNNIGEAGVIEVADGLSGNCTLDHISLAANKISDAAARAIASALRTNKTLTRLNISGKVGSDISNSGLKIISESLEGHPMLVELMATQPTDQSVVETLIRSLRNSKNIVKIWPFAQRVETEEFQDPEPEELESESKELMALCRNNRKIAANLIRKAHRTPEELTASDMREIAERLPAIIYVDAGNTTELIRTGEEKYKFDAEFFSLLQRCARSFGVTLEFPAHFQRLIQEAEVVVPRSISPNPLKVDRTITISRLKERKSDGRTNIQIFAEQGQLGDLFSLDVWQGRREEMDQAWELVPAKYRNQVNIESVRAQLGAEESRARFRRDDGEIGHGF